MRVKLRITDDVRMAVRSLFYSYCLRDDFPDRVLSALVGMKELTSPVHHRTRTTKVLFGVIRRAE